MWVKSHNDLNLVVSDFTGGNDGRVRDRREKTKEHDAGDESQEVARHKQKQKCRIPRVVWVLRPPLRHFRLREDRRFGRFALNG